VVLKLEEKEKNEELPVYMLILMSFNWQLHRFGCIPKMEKKSTGHLVLPQNPEWFYLSDVSSPRLS